MICAIWTGGTPQLPYSRKRTAAPESAAKPRLCDST